MWKLGTILKRLTARSTKHRKASDRFDSGGHRDRITVMLVPSAAWGKPLQFQTTKRVILAILIVGTASALLVALGGLYLLGRAIFSRGEVAPWVSALEQQHELAALREENRQLKADLNAQIEETRQRITRVNRLLNKLSGFTDLPLDVPTTSSLAATSESVRLLPALSGRGGPLVGLDEMLQDDLLARSGQRAYRHVREMQVFALDAAVARLDRAVHLLGAQHALLATTPLICPVQGEYTFTDRFGKRLHPLYRRVDFHSGLDISAVRGTPIIAPADGRVLSAMHDKAKGLTLTLDHGLGLFPKDGVPSIRGFKTRYFHCSRILVKTGARVRRGDVIALVGSTGISTGSHCHYEVLVDDVPVDPEYLILDSQ
ncbi:MAG: M23 family metallopeptidase [Candidatus Sumerlaeia bacterium]|nr:M23 family metallopeptidase [Candidatus Sumerlaeia bacterium]